MSETPRRRPRNYSAEGVALDMSEKVGRLGALYEGLDEKVVVLDQDIKTVGRKLDSHIISSDARHQEIKDLLLQQSVQKKTNTEISRTVKFWLLWGIEKVLIVAGIWFGSTHTKNLP